MTVRPRVVYWNNQPTPYVVDRFNAVADQGDVSLEAWFDREREPDRSWEVDTSTWRFPYRYLNTHDSRSSTANVPIEHLARTRPDVFVANYDRAYMALGLIAGRRYARRVAVRCLPTWPAWVPVVRRLELAKMLLFRSVDGAKVPGPDGAAYAMRYGLPADRIWSVAQSVDVGHFASARTLRAVQPTSRNVDCTFLYVGRLWTGKGIDDLLSAYRWVIRHEPGVRLRLVGDGPDEARFRHATRDLPGVQWAGFIQPTDLPAVYADADVLVFPTLGDPNGLVVEEAMAAGLPVIATAAAGDIRRRVRDNVTGFVVPPSDPAELAKQMLRFAQNPELRDRFGTAAAYAHNVSNPAAYARDFTTFVEGVLALPRRRGPAVAAAAVLASLALSRPPFLPSSHRV